MIDSGTVPVSTGPTFVGRRPNASTPRSTSAQELLGLVKDAEKFDSTNVLLRVLQTKIAESRARLDLEQITLQALEEEESRVLENL
jgi:hypothetical protein